MSDESQLVTVECPTCRQPISIPLASGATTFTCPLCAAPFQIQDPSQTAPSPTAPISEAAPSYALSRRWSGGAVLTLSLGIMLLLGGGLAALALLSPSERSEATSPDVEWIDATRSGVTIDGVTVRVLAVEVGPVRAKTASGAVFVSDREDYWTVRVRIRNGSDRPIEYRTWHAAEFPGGSPKSAILRDTEGARFVMQQFEDVAILQGQTIAKRLAPRESTQDVIVFAAPDDFDREALTELRLELPGAACQVNGVFRQSIPKSLVE